MTLLAKCLRKGNSPEVALSRVLTRYDELYTKNMNAFYQAWENGWNYGLDEMPDSAAAPLLPVLTPRNAKSETTRTLYGVRVTYPGEPPIIKTYPSVKQAAKGEFVSVTTVRGRLNGMYTKKPRLDRPTYEWCEYPKPMILRVFHDSGKIDEYSSVVDAAASLYMSASTIYDKLNGRYTTRRRLGEPRFEWIK